MHVAPQAVEGRPPILDSVEAAIGQRLGKERMDLWFRSGTRWKLQEPHTLLVEVSSEFLANCISSMFRTELQAAISQVLGPDWGVRVVARGRKSDSIPAPLVPPSRPITYDGDSEPPNEPAAAESSPSPDRVPPVTASATTKLPNGSPSKPNPTESIGDGLVPSLRLVRPERSGPVPELVPTLDRETERLVQQRRLQERRWEDFLVGEHNRFAHTGAEMVLERPGQINPLLIHGPNGVGKSHLAQGLAHRLRHQYRMRRVLFLTGEQFTIEYTESARGSGFANFRRKYRDVEALIIDDIQFCLGKAGTLSELRNTIDMLLRDGRQVVLVADRSLGELASLGADLYARLSGGMTCGIEPMDPGTRRRLLERLCTRQNLEIGNEALDAIAVQCGGDARLLQGIVHRLVAQHRLQNRTLSAEDALRCTADLVRASQPVVRLNDIERVVCEAFGLDSEMLRAKSKCQTVSQPRMLAMFLARKYTRSALSEIGEFFGKRQHSTVISAQKKVELWLSSDDAIAMGRSRVNVRDIVRTLEATLQVG